MRILVTGAAGYIGSHLVATLAEAGHIVAGIDNFSSSDPQVLPRLRRLAGRRFDCVVADVRDQPRLRSLFLRHRPDAVVHLASLRTAPDAALAPLTLFDNNVGGLGSLLGAMRQYGTRMLVLPSSASLYGAPTTVPVDEDSPARPLNPYDRSKLIGEQMLADLQAAEAGWQFACLRHSSLLGAHPAGLLDAVSGTGDGLVPAIVRAAQGQAPLTIHGRDYPSVDGTVVRDYLHVCDLAVAQLATLEALPGMAAPLTLNLGSGRGHTVLQLVEAFAQASGRPVPHRFGPRRAGDVPALYARCDRAARLLGWRAHHDLAQMCVDTWRCRQPDGQARPVAARADSRHGAFAG